MSQETEPDLKHLCPAREPIPAPPGPEDGGTPQTTNEESARFMKKDHSGEDYLFCPLTKEPCKGERRSWFNKPQTAKMEATK